MPDAECKRETLSVERRASDASRLALSWTQNVQLLARLAGVSYENGRSQVLQLQSVH